MKKLKILQVTNRLPYPLNDGGNIATYYVTSLLHELGHEITLASLNTKKHFYDPAVLKKIAKVHTTYLDTTFTNRGVVSSFFKSMPYNVKRFYSNDFEEKLKYLVTNETFDIIQLEGIYLSVYLPVLRNNSSAKIILRSHNIESEIWTRVAKREKNILKKIFLFDLNKKIKKFEINQLNKFDGIIAITDKDAKFYTKHGYKGKLTTINVGVDLETFQPSAIPPKENTLCFLGSMEWIPNQEALMWFLKKVWPKIYQSNPDLELHVAGKNPPDVIRNIKIPGVIIHGAIDSAIDFLNSYQIMVVPLLSGGGMRLKIVEAMALGKCIITTSIGAEGISIEDSKHCMIADNETQFIEKINRLLGDKSFRSELSKNALALTRLKYNWKNLIKDFESFYLELL